MSSLNPNAKPFEFSESIPIPIPLGGNSLPEDPFEVSAHMTIHNVYVTG